MYGFGKKVGGYCGFIKIAVFGIGKVGALAAELLSEASFQVTSFDVECQAGKSPFDILNVDVSNTAQWQPQLVNFDAVLSCLPFHLNKTLAQFAHDNGLHYFDLTEDMSTTQFIETLGRSSKTVMVPQCGLAPGLIAIIGADLASHFSKLRSLKLRVGALPQHPSGLLGYSFNWSPQGVVNEYLNDCEVIEEGERKWVSAMEWQETIVINGVQLEAFTTSGGLGSMCDTYQGRIENLDYKTLRYPGHAKLMNYLWPRV